MKFRLIFLLIISCTKILSFDNPGVHGKLAEHHLDNLKNALIAEDSNIVIGDLEKEDLEFLCRIKKENNFLVYPNTDIPILNFCVYKGYHHCVKYLLNNDNIIRDINSGSNRITPLGEAILWFKRIPKIYTIIIKLLLSANADPNKWDPLALILKNSSNKNVRLTLVKLFLKYEVQITFNHFKQVIEKELIEEMILLMQYAEIQESELAEILLHQNKNILYAVVEFNDGQYLEKLLKIAKMKRNGQVGPVLLTEFQRSRIFEREKYLESLISYRAGFPKETSILADLIPHVDVHPIILEYCKDPQEEIFIFLLDKYKNGYYEIVKKTLTPLYLTHYLSVLSESEVQNRNLSRKKIWPLHTDVNINKYFNDIIDNNLTSIHQEYNDYHDNFFGWTPLMWTAFVGNIEITKNILATCKKEDFFKKDILGNNASTIAKLFGNYEIHEIIEQAMKEIL